MGETNTEKINTQVPSGWYVYNTFVYRDALDPLKLYSGKDCVEFFCREHQRKVK